MKEQEAARTHDRSTYRANFLTKLHRYQRLLFGKWWVLILLAAIGVGGGYAISCFQPPQYSSFGRMMVNLRLSLPEGSVYTEEWSQFVGTQAALMQSGMVVQRAHGRVLALNPGTMIDPVKLKVTVLPRTTIFVIQGTGTNATYTQGFVQACMEEYTNLKKEMKEQTSDTTVAGLTEEFVRKERELRGAEADLIEFQTNNSVVLLDQGNTTGSYLALLNQRLAMLKSEYQLLKSLTLEQNLEREQNPTTPLALAGGTQDRTATAMDSEYLKAKQQLLLLKAEQEDLGQFLRPKHPKMVAMSEEIARRERLLDIFRQQSADQLESRKNSLELQIANLEKDVQEWDSKTQDASRKSAELLRLKGNVQRIQTAYERLSATLQTLDVNKEITPETVAILESASPALSDNATLSKLLIGGAVVGVLAGLGLLLLLDRLDDRVASVTELQHIFDEEVLGQVPKEKAFGPREPVALIQPTDERHSFVEAYRNLRSSLFFMGNGSERPKTILLTSSVPNEGKSLTSANLAITLANAGMRVLLVDADLRKGNLHGRFSVASQPGLTEALSEGLAWQETVRETKYRNLSLLPRGAVTQRSSEFFLDARTQKFLKEASEKFDAVVVDTAPVMAADDVTSLAPLVDGVVFVIRAEYTSARVAKAALDALRQRQAEILGLVFNSVRASSVDYYYYYKYKDYYSTTTDKSDRRSRGTRRTAERATEDLTTDA